MHDTYKTYYHEESMHLKDYQVSDKKHNKF